MLSPSWLKCQLLAVAQLDCLPVVCHPDECTPYESIISIWIMKLVASNSLRERAAVETELSLLWLSKRFTGHITNTPPQPATANGRRTPTATPPFAYTPAPGLTRSVSYRRYIIHPQQLTAPLRLPPVCQPPAWHRTRQRHHSNIHVNHRDSECKLQSTTCVHLIYKPLSLQLTSVSELT